MKKWAQLLAHIGAVEAFDYPYQSAGRKRPDPHAALVEAHAAALGRGRAQHGDDVVLIGKSMGGRIGCHLALEAPALGNVCLGYPLVSPSGKGPLRDQVLLDVSTPICFVQGTRDPLCPLDLLGEVLARRSGRSVLHVVPTGDHSLLATKAHLTKAGVSQEDLDRAARDAIEAFCRSL
jgi:predicted alpha/beta-hydrolase family hydrolase